MTRARRGARPTQPVALGLAALVLAATFAVQTASAAASYASDSDVFWLAATGRDIVASGAVPRVNGYSYVDGGLPWTLHETLFALLFYGLLHAVGPAAATLLGIVGAARTFFASMAHLFARCKTLIVATACGLFVLSCHHILLSPRPAFASLFFVPAMIAIAFAPGFGRARAACAVLLELVWTQAHGSFPLGVVLLVVGALDEGRSRKERRAWLGAAAASLLVTFVNPYGYHLHGLVSRYLHPDDPTAHVIQEHILGFLPLWRSFSSGFQSPGALAWLGVVLAFFAALALRDLARGRRVARALLVLATAAMGVYQVRNLVLGVLVGALLTAPHLDEIAERLPVFAKQSDPRRRPGLLALAVALPGLLLGAVLWVHTCATRTGTAWIASGLGGPAFVRLASALPPRARVYAAFKPSALLLWAAADRGVKVFYDPRNDCYSARVATASLQMERATPDTVLDILENTETEYAIVQSTSAVGGTLAADEDWTRLRTDHGWAILRRDPHVHAEEADQDPLAR